MDYEKKYKEALQRASKLKVQNPFDTVGQMVGHIFPELKESEDERIRQALIDYFDDANKADENPLQIYGIHTDKVIAWLEKQGEHANFLSKIQVGDKVTRNEGGVLVNISQLERVAKPRRVKSADKVESKFPEEDWIVHHGTENIYQVVAVINNQYQLKYGNTYTLQNCVDVVRCARLYDVTKDAKNGDVLCYKDEISLYKHSIKNCTTQEITFGGFVYHCCYDGKRFITDSLYSLTEQDKMDIHPATKEQRDLLFQKLEEAGYEWDAQKKELKKIGQKPTEWSEEDEEMFNAIIADIQFTQKAHTHEVNQVVYEREIDWLNSLKQRIGG